MKRAEKYPAGEHEEYFDPDPVELPVGYEHPETIQEMIRRMVKDEQFLQAVKQSNIETFEESDDLDPDEPGEEFVSHYEVQDMARDTFSERYQYDEERGEYVPREREVNPSEPAAGSRPEVVEAEPQVSKKKVKKPVAEVPSEGE